MFYRCIIISFVEKMYQILVYTEWHSAEATAPTDYLEAEKLCVYQTG